MAAMMATRDTSATHAVPEYYYMCTEVSATCPVEATTLGYFPNRGINFFFAVAFGIAGVTTLTLGTWKRTWSYTAFITAGCMLELAGYGARITLSTNPWNKEAFETQICAIILAPTLVCISIYLTLKHVCLALNPALSRIRPHLYPFIFVPLDVSCLLVQAIGGALAASAGYTNYTLLQHGNRAIIAGITLQVVVLLGFGLTAADYYRRVRAWVKADGAGGEAGVIWRDARFRLFVSAVAGAYSGVLIRCIYRIAEMSGGWGNKIMQDQPSFIVLEGFMILIPCLLLAAFPPGFLFPQMATRMSARGRRGGSPFGKGTSEEKGHSRDQDHEASPSGPGDTGDESRDHNEDQTTSAGLKGTTGY
ncbi:RTA1 like protein-domain-containing protein [Podospora appendiculata]|uniref:RTA1 like protein-domain-containing protein n=1 Tax=Podospora appendiculata TaxID=314037 RepID=A0AAE0X7Z5_9PEZI|nr:RTA1 like protein-domain-containing protein [Podospora appendiculata]